MVQAYEQQVKTYHITRDSGLDLRALLVGALVKRQPVAVVTTNAHTLAVAHHIGMPTNVDPAKEWLTFRLPDGGTFRCRPWDVDRAGVIADESEAT